ncbi:hypothetical protein JXB28_05610 [Candidatus Woesearchaeota archaeon]|nr:hypothetical protein [Candidatus Woesearchaeota archaeon]
MKKPYLKKYKQVNGYTAWIVDGMYIRKNLDIEFTNYGQHISQHGRFDFIPKGEFWIDKDFAKGHEEEYYLAHMLTRQSLTDQHADYNKALEEADLAEKQARHRSRHIKKLLAKKLDKRKIAKLAHKKLLRKYKGKAKVWLVKGKLLRNLVNVDFVQGGHDKVYSFIPKNEVWIDDSLNPEERKFVLLHELIERNLMCWGWVYAMKYEIPWMHSTAKKCDGIEPDTAHARASEAEQYYRKKPKGVEERIKEELAKTTLF